MPRKKAVKPARSLNSFMYGCLTALCIVAVGFVAFNQGKKLGTEEGTTEGYVSGLQAGHLDGFQTGKEFGLKEGRKNYRENMYSWGFKFFLKKAEHWCVSRAKLSTGEEKVYFEQELAAIRAKNIVGYGLPTDESSIAVDKVLSFANKWDHQSVDEKERVLNLASKN